MKIRGVDICPVCGYENGYEIDESEWLVQCACCGLPFVTCDRCESLQEVRCGEGCVHEIDCNRIRSDVKEFVSNRMKQTKEKGTQK